MKKIISKLSAVNIIILTTIAVVAIQLLPTVKLDFTKNKIHSLSPASKDIVSKLNDKVVVTVYKSQELPPEIRPIEQNLKDILNEFRRINESKIDINYKDASSKETAAEAEKEGIAPLQFSSIKNDKLEVSNGYLGLVLEFNSKKEVLPVAGDVANLEYFLTSSIKKLSTNEKKEVLLISGPQDQHQLLQQSLSSLYEVKNWGVGSSDYSKTSGVIVTIPSNNDKELATNLRKWQSEGKFIVVMGSEYQMGQDLKTTKIELPETKKWMSENGIELSDEIVYDINSGIATFRTERGNVPLKYPYWVIAGGEGIDSSLPVTAGINSVLFPWSVKLDAKNGALVLVKSSKQSGSDNQVADVGPMAEKWKQEPKYSGALNLASINIDKKIAIFGTNNFVNDQFISNSPSNLGLILNTVDYLAGDKQLLSIRSKDVSSSPIRPMDENIKNMVKIGVVALPTIIVACLFFVLKLIRNKYNAK